MSEESAIAPDPEERNLEPSNLTFPVVGIGASAGGLAALQAFFENMPAKSGMAFVVILHLSPTHESFASSILGKHTRMPVLQVVEDTTIEPDTIYVVSPDRELSMNDGLLRPSEQVRPPGQQVVIDVFFRSLAQVHRARAVGIVLSGAGADGAVGLARLKELGGVTIAQSPEDAEYDSMPRSAIATGMVDIVLPVTEMPQRLLELWQNMQEITLPHGGPEDLHADPSPTPMQERAAEEALIEILQTLRLHTRHDFRHYKRATVLRRIERRLQVRALPDLPAYRDYLKEHPGENLALLQDMLISVTNFFRDREAFDALEREVIPSLFANRSPDEPLRAWIAGCATGEEAYSVAMLLREQADHYGYELPIQVFATDVDERAIAAARSALYPEAIVHDVSPTRLRHFFTREKDHYRVSTAIRESVLFASHNVLLDPPFSRLDLICCRNLLIYVNRDAQAQVLRTFHFALKPGGFLFLGSSESADASPGDFPIFDKKHRIYRSAGRPSVPGSLPPLHDMRVKSAGTLREVRDTRRASFGELHLRALEELGEPSLLVDEAHNVLHMTRSAGRYLEHGGGVPSHNLTSNVVAELRLDIRTALFRAAQDGTRVAARTHIGGGDRREALDILVEPFSFPEREGRLILVTFRRLLDAAASAPVQLPPELARDPVVQQLEAEIRELKKHLQEAVHHSETSMQDLQASNEELQAINEELRSASEELETSKEELQSMNEELTTVNYELKSRVDEGVRTNEDLQNLVAATDVATVFVDADMRITRFTPQAAGIFNVIPTDVGRPLFDITHQLDYAQMAGDVASALRTMRLVERRVRAHDGTQFLARILPYQSGRDRGPGALLSFVDVSSLHAAQERVRSSNQRLRIAAETTRDYAILTADEGGVITSWNAGAERAFGWTSEEAVGQPASIIFLADDVRSGAYEGEMAQARELGRAADERWHVRKDGTQVYMSGVLIWVDEDGERGFTKIVRDIVTEALHLQLARASVLEQERVASQRAEEANRMKDEFLAVMSHELKNPLNLIQVNAELLGRLPEARSMTAITRAGDAIERAVRSQARIIDDLLDLSRARTGKLALQFERLRMSELADLIVDAMHADATAKGVTLELQVDENTEVRGDQTRVEQIVWNLLRNALKFTPRGGRVDVTIVRERGFAKLVVADTGAGIAPGFLPHVFNMFSQERSERSPVTGGLGIGLALVQELAAAQGGRVTAESAGLGKGSRISVWLPLFGVAEDGRPLPPAAAGLQGLRVMAVDDWDDMLNMFAALLRSEGAIVDTAQSGTQALKELKSAPFDLLITDIAMPEMDGYELVTRVRADESLRQIVAVAVTGFGREVDSNRARDAGFDAHVSKPISMELLKSVVAEARGRRGPAQR